MSNLQSQHEVPESRPMDFIETNVAGIMYDGRQTVVPSLALREKVRLQREPTNPFDPNAIKVERQNGEHFGYVPKELAGHISTYTEADELPIEATITELISDAAGSNFRVRICLELSKFRRMPEIVIPSPELEFHYEDTRPDIYVFINGSEALFLEVKRVFDVDGMTFLRSGLCYQPAGNGRQYQWYLKIDRTSGITRARLERFFLEHFNVVSEDEKAGALEKTRQEYLSEKLRLQEELSKTDQEAQAFEALAGELDAENRQRIDQLKSKVNDLEGYIDQIDREKHALEQKNQSLQASFKPTHTTLRDDDIPDNVGDTLRSVAGESLTLTQSLKVISSIFPRRIAILETAWKSAADSIAFRDRKKAFGLLWKLAAEYWSVLASGRGDVDARTVFGEAYAAKESEMIENNRQSRRLRTFTYMGKPIEMMRHLKIGVKHSTAETLRIHFEWVAEIETIVIGHCGEHL